MAESGYTGPIPDAAASTPKRRDLWLGVGQGRAQETGGKMQALAGTREAETEPSSRLATGNLSTWARRIILGTLTAATVASIYDCYFNHDSSLNDMLYEHLGLGKDPTPNATAGTVVPEKLPGVPMSDADPESFIGQFDAAIRMQVESITRGEAPTAEVTGAIKSSGGFVYNNKYYELRVDRGYPVLVPREMAGETYPRFEDGKWTLAAPDSAPPSGEPAAETPPTTAKAPELEDVVVAEATLTDRDGLTQGILKLKQNWPEGVEMPKWLANIHSEADAARWAEANGFFKPEQVRDSVVMYGGDKLVVDGYGNLVLHSANGTTEVIVAPSGEAAPGALKDRSLSDTVPTRHGKNN